MSVAQLSFDFGDRLTLAASFRDAAGAAADPTTVRWRVRPPAGDEVLITLSTGTYTMANPAVGTHTLSLTPPSPGQWAARVEGLGAVAQAAEIRWLVRASGFATAAIS